jgi:hypothetical protein
MKTKGVRKTIDVLIKMGGEKSKMYFNQGERIKVTDTENQMKVIIAREISNWLSAPDRYWGFNGSIDKNSNRLFDYLTDKFPDYTWTLNHSQGVFDIISLDAKVAIELKSARAGSKQLVTNASIYPDVVSARDALGKGFKYGNFSLDTRLDVLLVCVERTKKDKVYDFAIVDGSYWGFTEEDFKACKDLYTQLNLNSFKEKLSELVINEYGNTFVEKMINSTYGNGVNLDFRKLISISNPVGRLKSSGWWS